jgi:hypothetical protein
MARQSAGQAYKFYKEGKLEQALHHVNKSLESAPHYQYSIDLKKRILADMQRRGHKETAGRVSGGSRDWGLGLLLGSPSGISAKKFIRGGANALEAVVGWSLLEGQLQVRADYLWEFPGMIEHPLWRTSFGAGGVLFAGGSESVTVKGQGGKGNIKVSANKPLVLGALGVAAISFNPGRWEIYLEGTPILSITPGVGFGVGFGLGGRYYF